ncbi:hypothetical protein HZZ02_24640, partial [Streptococcus danieliae]|nr:hypothetical protein [Streptococcus danieliae]
MLEIGGQESLLFLYDGILLVFRGALKKQAATIQSLTEENSLLREQVAYLTQKLYGKSSEKNTVQSG